MESCTRGLRGCLSLVVPALLLSACIDPLEVPACTPVPWSEASVSGDTVTTTTGLRYIDMNGEGIGLAAGWCQFVAVHYTASILDGDTFESTRDRNQPLVFTPGMGGLIDGFEQGVIGLQAGNERRLIIPPELGYGSEPHRNIEGEVIVPPNSTLIYDLEVLEVAVP